jgi:hypothetical protein
MERKMDNHDHLHDEDPQVCITVGIIFIVVLAVIIFLGIIN